MENGLGLAKDDTRQLTCQKGLEEAKCDPVVAITGKSQVFWH